MDDMREGLRAVAKNLNRVSRGLGDPNRWGQQDALEALRAVREARLEADEVLRRVEVEAAREAFVREARWGDIARAAGVTRQTAQATYRDRENKPRRQPTRTTPQPLAQQARRPSGRDTNSWVVAVDDFEEPDHD